MIRRPHGEKTTNTLSRGALSCDRPRQSGIEGKGESPPLCVFYQQQDYQSVNYRTQQKAYKQPSDRVLERSTSTEDVDQVPHLKGTPYLTRMVDNHPIRDPLKVKDILHYLHFGQTEDIRLKSAVFGKNPLVMITGRSS